MFGLAERGRLAMYDSVLRQAKSDPNDVQLFHTMSLMGGTALLGEAAKIVAGRPGTFDFQTTLGRTIEAIPSAYLAGIDSVMLRAITAPGIGEDQSGYQMATLINGLVFVRIVEVTRPSLSSRAYEFRNKALAFMEPLFDAGMQMMLSSASASATPDKRSVKHDAAAALETIGINIDPVQEDDQFCIEAVSELISIIMARAGARPVSFDDTDAFIAGLFSFAISDLMTQKVGGTFEIVSAVVAGHVLPGLHDPQRQGEFVSEIIKAFNGRASASTVMAVGRAADGFLRDPSGPGLGRVIQLFELSRKHVA